MKRSAKVVAAVLIVAASVVLMAQTYPSARFAVLIVDTWATITNGLTLYTGTNVWVLTPASTGDTPLELNPVGTTTGGFRWWKETSAALPASFAPGADFNTLGAFLGNPYDGTRCDGSSANCQWAGLYLRSFTPPVTTNALYNASGALSWGVLPVALSAYGEMFAYENGTATVILTNNAYHAIQGIFSTGAALSSVTFTAGSTGPIASVAEGTPSDGKVTVTDVAHGLATGDVVTIVNSTDYNGAYLVTRLTADTFEITATWTATRTGTWIEGDYLTVTAAGVYAVDWNASADGVSATSENYHVELAKNVASLDNLASEALVSGGADVSALSGGGLVTFAANDRLWMQLKQTTAGTDNVTLGHLNVRVRRVGS